MKGSIPSLSDTERELISLGLRKYIKGSRDTSTTDDFILSKMPQYTPPTCLEEVQFFKTLRRHSCIDCGCAKCKWTRHQLVTRNQRLVFNIAKSYRGRGLDFCEMFQEGVLGLNHAIDKFDIARGNKFSTYATYWIRESVMRALKEKALMIRLPPRVHDARVKVLREWSNIVRTEKRQPTSKELAERLGMDQREVEKYKGWFEHDSLNKQVHEDSELGDSITDHSSDPPERLVEAAQDREYVVECVNSLPAHLGDFIKRYFGLINNKPRTDIEMATIYRLTVEQVHQRRDQALEELKSVIDPSRLNSDCFKFSK